MTYEELRALQDAAYTAEKRARRLKSQLERIAEIRRSDRINFKLFTSRGIDAFNFHEDAERAVQDVLTDSLPDLLRVAEFQLMAEARAERNKAQALRAQVAAYLSDEPAEEPV